MAQWGVGGGAGPLGGGGNFPTNAIGVGVQGHVRYVFFKVFSAGVSVGYQSFSAPGYDAVADRSFSAVNTLVPFTAFVQYELNAFHLRPFVGAELGAAYLTRTFRYDAGVFGAPGQNTVNLLFAPAVGVRLRVQPQLWVDAHVRYCFIPNGSDLLTTLPLSLGVAYTFASYPNHYLKNLKPKSSPAGIESRSATPSRRRVIKRK